MRLLWLDPCPADRPSPYRSARAHNRAVIDQRIQEYRDLLRRDPHSVKAHYGLGVAYFNLGLTEAAIDSLEKACSITPENPHIHTQLAVAWRERAGEGDAPAIDQMQDHIQYALRLDPDNVEALILASEAARDDHDIETAMMYSERAFRLEPERARALHERTSSEWLRWRYQRGEASAEDIRRLEGISPGLGETERAWARSQQREQVGAFGSAFSNSISKETAITPTTKAVRNGCLAGVGVSLVLCCVLGGLTSNVESGTTASTGLGFIYIALFFLPIVFAYLAWKAEREKDPFA